MSNISKTQWTLQDAQHEFRQVVNNALRHGPQYVTRRGVRTVVILSAAEYDTLTASKSSFKDFLLSCPRLDEPLALERQQDAPRRIEL